MATVVHRLFTSRSLATVCNAVVTPQRMLAMFVLPFPVITSLCLDAVSARMGAGHLLLPAQLPGTHWAMICVIRCLALTVSVA